MRLEHEGRRVVVTGAGSAAGRAVVAELGRAGASGGPDVVAVVAAQPAGVASTTLPEAADGAEGAGASGAADRVRWVQADLTSPLVVEHLLGADAVVHVAAADDLEGALADPVLVRRARVLRTAQAVTTASAAAGVQRVVVVTSAMVLGAREDAPVPLDDDAERRAEPDDGVVGDLLEVERVVERARRTHPGLRLCLLRPAALVGPGVDSVVTRHFEAPRLLSVSGASTRWQFCSVADLGRAVRTVVERDLDGDLTCGSEGSLAPEEVEQLAGMRRLELPAAIAFATAERLHRVGVLPMPATDLAFVVHPWVVSSRRLREAGWRPLDDNSTCLGTLLEDIRGRRALGGRRVERRDTALGAAGAAVAVVGTAAVWRQARARRRKGSS